MHATQSINLRISRDQKALIDHAARSVGKSRTAFVLENAVRCAEETLLDRTRFTLDAGQWDRFTAALDAPPSEDQAAKLRKLLSVEAPWGPCLGEK
jgi:uncharacterized protein (DUF1778 family)